jgi:hypothetical protein
MPFRSRPSGYPECIVELELLAFACEACARPRKLEKMVQQLKRETKPSP